VVICEEEMLARGNFVAKGSVVEEDFMVGGTEFGSKLRFDVVPIFQEFLPTVREGKGDGSGSFPPSGGPFRSCRDPFLRFRDSESNFRVTQAACSLFIRDNMVERREDLIEIDGIAFEDTFPLRGRDSGRRVVSDFEEELGLGNISIIGS